MSWRGKPGIVVTLSEVSVSRFAHLSSTFFSFASRLILADGDGSSCCRNTRPARFRLKHDFDLSHPADLVCSDESRSTQLELVVQLFLIGQAVLILGLQSGDTALHHLKLLFGRVQDLLRGFQVLLGFLECSLQGW